MEMDLFKIPSAIAFAHFSAFHAFLSVILSTKQHSTRSARAFELRRTYNSGSYFVPRFLIQRAEEIFAQIRSETTFVRES